MAFGSHKSTWKLNKSMSYSNFVSSIPKTTSLAHQASDGQNPPARSQNPLASGYQTRLSLHAESFVVTLKYSIHI